jgi:phthalate 4,5-dioxygenase oxygenase subunit
MPTEPAESSYKDRMRARSYPVREAGGMIWAYLGPPELEPPFPVFEWAGVPRDNVAFLKFVEHANYLQVAEGSIDSAHTRFLHRGSVSNVEEARRNALSRDLAPRLEVADTSYGFRYAAIRRPNENADVLRYVKITRYVLPATAITSRPMTEGNPAVTQMFVPIDDENTMHYSIWHSLDGKPVDEAGMRRAKGLEPGVDLDRGYRPHRSEANWWGQDPQAMRAITDHSRERLGTSDIAIIRLRRRLLENVRRFLAGKPLIGLEFPVDYGRLCHVSQCAIGMNERWEDIDTFAGEYVTPQPAAAG